MAKLLYICYVAFVCISDACAKSVKERSNVQSSDNSSLYRLPKDVLPESYDILLLTNITAGNLTYKGEVKIVLRVTEKTKQVILHSDKLKIINEKSAFRKILSNETFESVNIGSQRHDNETQFHKITFSNELTPGRYILALCFIGEVSDDLFGFYRSSYRVNNKIRWMGATQFSPIFARRAFPCMDEPGFKATFQLSIGHYGNETVTSNTLRESQDITDRPNYFIARFSRTARMSTYLLAWVIHDFRRVNTSDSRISLWTRLNAEPQHSNPFLIDGPNIYSALEAWMSPVRSPLDKVEQLAVPDFNFGAMENWGLVTFRESIPLIQNQVTPLRDIQANLVTLGHEYAHTWFGNLVTPSYWDVAWLKEGFATYFAYVALEAVHEDWPMEELFPIAELQGSLLKDAGEHNRTMNGRAVGDPRFVRDVMDFVTYSKAASIIRMVADVVGREVFKHAMHSYLQENQFKATTPPDLYKHLESALSSSTESSTLPVTISELIESWANQPHYPLVRVSSTTTSQLQLTQEPFRLNRNSSSVSRSWWIPLSLLSSTGEVSTWLAPNRTSTIVQLPAGTEWYILNPRQIGYFRVNYDAAGWQSLRSLLDSDDFGRLPAAARSALLDDAFNLARAGYEGYDLALDLARYLPQEVEYQPWVAACRAFDFLDRKLRDRSSVQRAFRHYAIDLITPIYQQLSFEERPSDSRIKKMQRDLILSTACSLNLEGCVLNAKSIFDNWIADEKQPVPANLKGFVYRSAIINGTDGDWINLWQRFLEADIHSEKKIMINALACTENPSFMNKYLQFSIRPDSDIAEQYRFSIIQSIIMERSKNIGTTLSYVENNLNEILRLKGTKFLERIFSTIGEAITSVEQADQLTLFIEKNPNLLGSTLESAKKAIKLGKANIVWIDSCASKISTYLSTTFFKSS